MKSVFIRDNSNEYETTINIDTITIKGNSINIDGLILPLGKISPTLVLERWLQNELRLFIRDGVIEDL